MRVVVVGLGVQGAKRRRVAGADAVATVDPVNSDADHRAIEDVPQGAYDAALVCVPDAAKLPILTHLAAHGKHALVEKPLLARDEKDLLRLEELAREHEAVIYTAYNHRFEPHFARMRETIASGRLGALYLARFFYGNGTARDVRASPWRDREAGVLPDLGSHLIDTALDWFGAPAEPFRVEAAHRFENRAFDHVRFGAPGLPVLEMEATLVSWRNDLSIDVYGELGSAHIESLCKWGPSTFRLRTRVLPSGRPPEEVETLVQHDPTWELEYAHFQKLCRERAPADLAKDVWLSQTLGRLCADALERFPG
jgi:predicted dehydrogenase